MSDEKCDVCGKNTMVKKGWHLTIPQISKGRAIYLNFCSYECVATYIEKNMALMFRDLNDQEKRLLKIEKKLVKKDLCKICAKQFLKSEWGK